MPNTASKTGSKCSFCSLNSAFSPVACALGVFPCLGCLDNVFQQPAKNSFRNALSATRKEGRHAHPHSRTDRYRRRF
ncbi:hypothetical protein C4K68_19465 [Pokkaliibacter plantistimulans]|uniref:Uncharacterized protein n=1 Tax=Proteobacteria bacterium 228 TaxID=2083153 RepID=A0A2S5KLQ7_9PROT|nr:hypothetical protein C4K68_19465 [Pokkaliibacter plantistimulans]